MKRQPESEKDIQRGLIDYLECLEKQKRLKYIRANAGMIPTEYKGKKHMVRLGKKGFSDLIVFLNGARTLFIEVKGTGKKQTADQLAFEHAIQRLGFEYHVVDNMSAGIELIQGRLFT